MKPIDELTDQLSAPLGDLIAEIGRGVAEAQQDMDRNTLRLLEELYQNTESAARFLQETGYRPNWYHIPEAEAEINVSLSVTGDYSQKGGGGAASSSKARKTRMLATPMNASYQNTFNYKMEAASRLKFKIVPIPEPSGSENLPVMPNLVGMDLKAATSLMARLEIPFEVMSGDAKIEQPGIEHLSKPVMRQEPAPGTLIVVDQKVRLNLV